ncbi:MAG: hypothetical protein A2086_12540 [Spirochaetes bacterium GWD1_27_9]|nr:MAG: hypothetical protein A2Z98_10915 [Spirochaetes bacterium GWB1_27_13]OHD44287.1 MAG: hypothetical protein A2086_12540 [Spirochaetes bacterium GWD1_27_9]
MNDIDYNFLENYFECNYNDIAGSKKDNNTSDNEENFKKQINVDNILQNKYAVLGIDIYQYSQYEISKQIVVPFLFQQMLIRTFKVCFNVEPFLFQQYNKGNFEDSFQYFVSHFIDTGDGGFLIFDTPIHAIVFAIYFESIVRNINSGFLYKKLGSFVGPLLLRYAITYNTVYHLINNKNHGLCNYYGSGIIDCSRIISKDRLNRCLIDEDTYKWFLYNTNGIETLSYMPIEAIKEIDSFKNYQSDNQQKTESFCFPHKRTEINKGIQRIDIQKIGEIKSKSSILSIYNLHLQFSYQLPFIKTDPNEKIHYFTVSLGNLNTEGIV